MRIVLRQGVAKLGKMGDVVEVAEGYARNFLLPKGLAMKASPANVTRIESEKRVKEKEQAELRASLTEQADKLAGVSISVTAKASEEGHLYGSVGAQAIAEILGQEGIVVEAEMIGLEEPIKEVGVYEVPVRLGEDFEAVCKVWVVAE